MARYKREHVFGAVGLVIGVGSLAIGAIALYWDHKRDKHLGIGETSSAPPRSSTGITPMPLPAAQKTPVAPPTTAAISDLQAWLNVINQKTKGQAGYLDPTGSAGPLTVAAIKAFQVRHNMTPSGKLDGMTQSQIANDYAYAARGQLPPEGAPMFAFRIVWDGPKRVWTAQDSMKFITEIPGHVDHMHPPTDQEVAAVLAQHYGPASSTGKALAAHRYEWTCADCSGIA